MRLDVAFGIHMEQNMNNSVYEVNFVPGHHHNVSVPVTENSTISQSPLSIINSNDIVRLRDAFQVPRIARSAKQKYKPM